MNTIKTLGVYLIILFYSSPLALAQKKETNESNYKRSSIKTAIGLGYNEGKEEIGLGLTYSIGYQKAYSKNDRLRFNPQLTLGGFQPLFITDLPDMHYRVTNLSYNIHYDVLLIHSFSMVLSGGVFGNYSRGLIGTGGYGAHRRSSDYFYHFYIGGKAGLGFRINPSNSRFAYEIKPLSLFLGNNGFGLGFASLGIDLKLRK